MLYLIPRPLHRLALRLAYRARKHYRGLVKPPIAGVSLIIEDEAGRILLVRHSYGPRGWALPGGGMGRGEAPQAAARREIAEEMGCGVAGIELLSSHCEMLHGAPHTAFVFAVRLAGEPRADMREIEELRWFAREELPGLTITRLSRARLTENGRHP